AFVSRISSKLSSAAAVGGCDHRPFERGRFSVRGISEHDLTLNRSTGSGDELAVLFESRSETISPTSLAESLHVTVVLDVEHSCTAELLEPNSQHRDRVSRVVKRVRVDDVEAILPRSVQSSEIVADDPLTVAQLGSHFSSGPVAS